MPQFINGTNNATITISDADHHIVTTSATVLGSSSAAIGFSGNNAGKLTVAGTVGSADGATNDGISTNADDEVIITQTGSVHGVDEGIVITGASSAVTVAGYVYGGDSGIYAFGNDANVTITSTGLVQGGSNRDGTDTSFPFAAAVTLNGAGNQTLRNDGTILADVNPTTGGTIAVLNAGNSFADNNSLGFDPSFSAVLHFFNTGTVIGSVFFAAGEDIYDARGGGTVSGTIAMGNDNDIFRGGNQAETASGGAGADFMTGGDGDDNLSGGGGNDDMRGGSGDDTLRGDNGNDSILGKKGNDVLRGDDGNDLLRGGRDDDNIKGGSGVDRIFGDRGDDVLSGDGANDVFVFRGGFGHDRILDFSDNNAEKIDLSAVAAIRNFNDLQNNHLSQDNGDAIITVGDNTIRLEGFSANALDAGDFSF